MSFDLNNSTDDVGKEAIGNLLSEIFQTYALLCSEYEMNNIHNISRDPLYNEVSASLNEKIQILIEYDYPYSVCIDSDEFILAEINEFNIPELLMWKGRASVITGSGFYNIESDGTDVFFYGEEKFTSWDKLFNQMGASLCTHQDSPDDGFVFWIGDQSNVFIPGTYMSIRPTRSHWNAMLDEWDDLLIQFNSFINGALKIEVQQFSKENVAWGITIN